MQKGKRPLHASNAADTRCYDVMNDGDEDDGRRKGGRKQMQMQMQSKQASKKKKRHAMIKQGAMIEKGKKGFNQQ